MNNTLKLTQKHLWKCGKCGGDLQRGLVKASYLGNDFEVEELKCVNCGLVLIDEELALGKMFEVEQSLEDK
ncbi:DNA-binding protein [Desulfosporosinus fructosivorans]|uniref:DNA-binding protein n=1 Tax=Desulfosporosinus fructosivorans TaxID=2018669 RepID=A0A4Z0R7P3_9FIRM|nr:CLJU_RS11820 family redox protein [Desulfosporosinus fructosivorans]TGE37606.1 DNA-binding protein [Desulfosporosinus fructosivorans]